jgi:hypothetical protein
MDWRGLAKMIGLGATAVAIFWLGMGALDDITESYDLVCEVQQPHGRCAFIGDQIYVLKAIVWAATISVPAAIVGIASSMPRSQHRISKSR